MHKENDGLAILNPDCLTTAHKTVIVLGVPRGGTSMVAGTLAKLGVFMGVQEKLAPFYENTELGVYAKNKNQAEAKKLIASYNQQHAVWGIKVLPNSWRFWLGKGLFREPVYVVVFRDILAIAKRRAVSLEKSLLKEMSKALWLNFCLLAFLFFNKRPALIVSYEKAVALPENFVNGVCDFIGLDDPVRINKAIAFVAPSPNDYVMRSTTRCQLDTEATFFGYLDTISPTQITGWVLSLADDTPVELELSVNGKTKQATSAHLARQDVPQADPRFREHCGFVFNIEDDSRLATGDCVEVKISGKEIHLINSPFVIA